MNLDYVDVEQMVFNKIAKNGEIGYKKADYIPFIEETNLIHGKDYFLLLRALPYKDYSINIREIKGSKLFLLEKIYFPIILLNDYEKQKYKSLVTIVKLQDEPTTTIKFLKMQLSIGFPSKETLKKLKTK
jgi:hypothetical protein